MIVSSIFHSDTFRNVSCGKSNSSNEALVGEPGKIGICLGPASPFLTQFENAGKRQSFEMNTATHFRQNTPRNFRKSQPNIEESLAIH